MAPNFKKMKAFGKKGSPQQVPQYDRENDLEAGQFLPETQNVYANIDVAVNAKPEGGALDEYRS